MAEDAENVVVEDVEEVIAGAGVVDPRLQPHGQLYEDLGEVTIDPSANQTYNLPFRLNWGQLVINAYEPIKAIIYFLLLFPMAFLNAVILVETNNNLRANRKAVTSKAELVRFFGLTLSMALDPTRGGIRSYWDDNLNFEETIFQRKSYGSRFEMTRHRFEDLRRYLSFGPEPADRVRYKIIYLFIYCIERRSMVSGSSIYRCFQH